jgi:hypothetical protein
MRQLREELNVLHMTIWRILHKQLLYPYHLQVQGLMPADHLSPSSAEVKNAWSIISTPVKCPHSMVLRHRNNSSFAL